VSESDNIRIWIQIPSRLYFGSGLCVGFQNEKVNFNFGKLSRSGAFNK